MLLDILLQYLFQTKNTNNVSIVGPIEGNDLLFGAETCLGAGALVQRAGGSGRMSPVRARTMKEYEQVWSTSCLYTNNYP